MTNPYLKQRKQELEHSIENKHDMESTGEPRQWDAAGVTGSEVCTICGLTRTYWRSGQNYPDRDEYNDIRGNKLSLAEAAAKECK